MHGELARDIVATARRLDGVDIADHVGNGHVGRGQLFHVALAAREPRDRRCVSLLRDQVAAAAANGPVRIVVDFAPFHVGRRFIQQRSQQPDQPRFGLPAQAEQNEIVAREDGVDHLRHHGVLVPEDGGKQRVAALDFADQVLAELVLDAAARQLGFRKGTLAQRAESARYFLGDLRQAIPPLCWRLYQTRRKLPARRFPKFKIGPPDPGSSLKKAHESIALLRGLKAMSSTSHGGTAEAVP